MMASFHGSPLPTSLDQTEGNLMSNVSPPSSGLGSNFNYFLNDDCTNLDGVVVRIAVSTDIVASAGFGFQLNAYSPSNETCAIQQDAIVVDTSGEMTTIVNNWQNAQTALINNWVSLYKLPSGTLPAAPVPDRAAERRRGQRHRGDLHGQRFRGRARGGQRTRRVLGHGKQPARQLHGTDGHVHELNKSTPAAGWANKRPHGALGRRVCPRRAARSMGTGARTAASTSTSSAPTATCTSSTSTPPRAGRTTTSPRSPGGGVLPVRGSALDGYWGTGSSQHVNFIGTDGHVHELYIHPGRGLGEQRPHHVLRRGRPAGGGSALDGYWGTDSSQHVNFIGTPTATCTSST